MFRIPSFKNQPCIPSGCRRQPSFELLEVCFYQRYCILGKSLPFLTLRLLLTLLRRSVTPSASLLANSTVNWHPTGLGHQINWREPKMYFFRIYAGTSVIFLAMYSSRVVFSRFGKIIFIDSYAKVAHLQYYQHSSQTMLQEIADPQELFLTETCGAIQMNSILSKIVVHSRIFRVQSSTQLDVLDFFCK